ncbi:hypothetical protein PR003_g1207 [Phytophthora rubi]|uniref:Uncharacterized protein n=1 Tax=Phytophthora rubi TaxID=129364 RepID=A0A6A3P826_9STRA|nr:hypothetical protein PR002_g1202 [Phytophthora rubi]KAE9051852.1 hypothetical protein PR001_g1065 [Phytophthora rubi]KAE9358562.1 hypothetical protein PR003_g1207 [Phytophthora rubi]
MADSKLQDAVNKMVDRLDRSVLRGMQRDGYLCAAKVFESKSWSSDQLAAAVERCQMPTQQINQFMQQEMQSFQNRLQRGVQDCQDKAQDALPAGGAPNEAQIARAQKDMDKCVSSLVDAHIKLLPNVNARIEQAVAQVKQQQQ